MKSFDEINNMSTRQINAHFRKIDDSHLWPICNKFDATERAIRRLRKTGFYNGGMEYWLALEDEISQVVNSQI